MKHPQGGAGGLDGRLDRVNQTLSGIARDLEHLKHDVGQLTHDVGQLTHDVNQLKTEVRERLATKVEVEGLRHNLAMMADGYAETQRRLTRVADLLTRYLNAP